MLKGYDIVIEGYPGLLMRLDSCDELLVPIQKFFGTWPFNIGLACPSNIPLLTVSRASPEGYIVNAPWLVCPVREVSVTCLLCSLSIELIMAVCRSVPSLLHMHAAAAQLPDGVCLFLGNNHAGKSSLITRLMAEGCVGFGDDLVGIISDNEVFSFGIPPRLRLPLPPSLPLRTFVHDHTGETDGHYKYLAPGLPVLAQFGTRRKIAACIFLRRRTGGKTVLRNCTPDSRKLLSHCVLYRGTAGAALEAMQSLSSSVPCFELEYADLDSAAELLHSQYLADMSAPAHQSIAIQSTHPHRFSRQCILLSTLYRRKDEIILVSGEDGGYLLNEEEGSIFHLNRMGEGIWRMLEYPLSGAEVVDLLREIFPEILPEVIEQDVAQLFQQLQMSGLIEPCLAP